MARHVTRAWDHVTDTWYEGQFILVGDLAKELLHQGLYTQYRPAYGGIHRVMRKYKMRALFDRDNNLLGSPQKCIRLSEAAVIEKYLSGETVVALAEVPDQPDRPIQPKDLLL